MNFKRKLLFFLISFVFIIPVNTLAYSKYLIPGGENIGIKIQANGVYVVGFYPVNGKNVAHDAGFKIGDRIVSINSSSVNNIKDLISKITNTDSNISIEYGIIRDGKSKKITMNLLKEFDGTYKTGIYVKDTITGIGTLTYIDPSDNTYGALGHEVSESSTGINFSMLKGNIFSSKITSLERAIFGKPGEKNAKIDFEMVYGNIINNLETGIYGKLNKKISDEVIMEVMNIDDVEIGNAEIITVLNDDKKEKFNIEILSIDKNNPTKNFFVKITDNRLLDKTGGIIKGMSGSPIIQNGKIVGAITHTVLDDPSKGFGISIIKMLESVE